MTNEERAEFQRSIEAGYNSTMNLLYMRFGSVLDRDEIRLEFLRFVSDHVVDKTIEASRKRQTPVGKTNNTVELLSV